jgi:hypothetical protein
VGAPSTPLRLQDAGMALLRILFSIFPKEKRKEFLQIGQVNPTLRALIGPFRR